MDILQFICLFLLLFFMYNLYKGFKGSGTNKQQHRRQPKPWTDYSDDKWVDTFAQNYVDRELHSLKVYCSFNEDLLLLWHEKGLTLDQYIQLLCQRNISYNRQPGLTGVVFKHEIRLPKEALRPWRPLPVDVMVLAGKDGTIYLQGLRFERSRQDAIQFFDFFKSFGEWKVTISSTTSHDGREAIVSPGGGHQMQLSGSKDEGVISLIFQTVKKQETSRVSE